MLSHNARGRAFLPRAEIKVHCAHAWWGIHCDIAYVKFARNPSSTVPGKKLFTDKWFNRGTLLRNHLSGDARGSGWLLTTVPATMLCGSLTPQKPPSCRGQGMGEAWVLQETSTGGASRAPRVRHWRSQEGEFLPPECSPDSA